MGTFPRLGGDALFQHIPRSRQNLTAKRLRGENRYNFPTAHPRGEVRRDWVAKELHRLAARKRRKVRNQFAQLFGKGSFGLSAFLDLADAM